MSRAAFLLTLVIASAHAQIGYTDLMFRKGLDEHSTAPLYVLVRLRDERGGESVVCTEGSSFLVATAIEHHFALDKQGLAQARAFAVSQPGRAFSFTNPEARVVRGYSNEELSRVRATLSSKSNSELREELRGLRYRTTSPMELLATAHVLLERGILVGRTDYTGSLYLSEP